MVVLRNTFRDIENFLRSLKWDAGLVRDVGWIIKGVLNSSIVLILLMLLVFNASRFVREAFLSYLDLVYADIFTFAVISVFTPLVAFSFYSRIKNLVIRLEEAVDAI